MAVVYSLVSLLLALLHWIFRRRLVAAEVRYGDAAAASLAAHECAGKGKHCATSQARNLLALTAALTGQDRAEARWVRWQSRCDRLAAVRGWMGGWLGKGFGYAMGCLDSVLGVLGLVYQSMGVEPSAVGEWVFYTIRFWGSQ
jgi:hypothetical protein